MTDDTQGRVSVAGGTMPGETHRNKLRRLRILQALGNTAPAPMGQRALLNVLAGDPELEPTIELVQQSLTYLWAYGLIDLIEAEDSDWVAGSIKDYGQSWLKLDGDDGLDIYTLEYQPPAIDKQYGRISSVDKLPTETRAWIDRALISRNFTDYTGLAEILAEQGLSITRSSLGRYAKRLKERVAKYKEKAETIKSLADVFEEDADSIMQGAFGAGLSAIMDAIEDGKYSAGKDTLSGLVKTLPGIARGFREAEKNKVEKETRKKVIEEAANKIEEIATAQGMDEENKRFWLDKFLKGM